MTMHPDFNTYKPEGMPDAAWRVRLPAMTDAEFARLLEGSERAHGRETLRDLLKDIEQANGKDGGK